MTAPLLTVRSSVSGFQLGILRALFAVPYRPKNGRFSCVKQEGLLRWYFQQENPSRKSIQVCWLNYKFSGRSILNMLIGYVRISKSDGSQSLDLQRDALLSEGVESDRIYSDLVSGRKDDRPGLRACIKALQPGNTLVVWKLDRLGRDLKHLVNTVQDFNDREIGLKVLAGAGAQIDTTTANGRLIFGIFAALAEFEAELIQERTKAGLAAARARGRMGGRPRKMTIETLKMAMAAMTDQESNASNVASRLGITTTTLYAYVNGDGSVKEQGQRLLDSSMSGRCSAEKGKT